MSKLLKSAPLLLTPLGVHESLHPGEGHRSLTAIVQDLGQMNGWIRIYPKPMEPARQSTYADLGYTWEDALEAEFKRRRMQAAADSWTGLILQKKFCHDNIHLIPDGHVPASVGLEAKLTFTWPPKQPSKLFTDHRAWEKQTQCYGHVLKIYQWHLYVCWVGGKIPEPTEYVFKYTKAECSKTWDEIRAHRDYLDSRERTEA